MPQDSLHAFSPASAWLDALRRREISSAELLDLYLARIEKYNPALNAIVIPNYDEARKIARKADDARARGEGAPLLGLPMTIKDCIDVQGLRGTAGVPECADRYPAADAPIAAKTRDAGAVLIGKTNVPPMAADWQSSNPVFGRTNNPWDLERTPGGSTGGGAAALAAGLTTLELGSDIGGSIRVPAAFCGVYGHRPSDTAIPHSGHFPGSPLPNSAFSMGVLGPLSRGPEDLELALDLLAGPEVGEDAAWSVTIPPARHNRLEEFRVAVMPPFEWLPVDEEIQTSLDTLSRRLRDQGAKVEVTQPDVLRDFWAYFSVYGSILSTLMNAGRSEEERRIMADEMADAEDPISVAFRRGLTGSAVDYFLWHGQREYYRAAYREFFRDWDLLIAPITLGPAFPHDDSPQKQRTLDVNGESVPYLMQLIYPAVATLVGNPSTAFPVGLNREGLPLGLQAIGPYLEDRTPIRFTALLSREFGGFQPPPGYE
jgi:amidase